LTDLSTFSPEYSNFIIISCVQVFATVLDYFDDTVDDVENLSTDNVDKWPLIAYTVDDVENLSTDNVDKCLYVRLLCGRCGKLIHNGCGKTIVRSVALWTMWKTYPQKLWKVP
jgi:hypothetical protein